MDQDTRQYLICSIPTNLLDFTSNIRLLERVQGVISHPPRDGRQEIFDSFVQRKLELDSGEGNISYRILSSNVPFMLRDLVYHTPVMSNPSPGGLG
jgi:hypothetical protein